MLQLIILLAVLALVSGVLGFTGVAVGFAAIAKVLFYIFLIGLVVSLVMHFFKGNSNFPHSNR